MEITLEQALRKGVEAHKAGKVQEADRYYTAILKTNPKHPDANHNMGVLAVGIGKVEEALPFFKTALEVNPSIAQFWLSYIDALIKLDRMADAKAVLEQAKGKGVQGNGFDQIEKKLGSSSSKGSNTQDPPKEKLKSLISLYTQGHHQQALMQASQLLEQFPKSINLYNIIGAANKGLGKLEEAIEAYTKAISLKPDFAEAYNNMGNVLQEQGKLEEALEAYKKALSIKPNNSEAYNNMGNALQDIGKLEEATVAFNKAISLKPDNADAYYNIGNVFRNQGKLEEALEVYKKAISIKPDYAEVYNNMGIVLKNQGRLEEAIEIFRKAISIKPAFAEAYNNMGFALKDQGKLDDAIEAYSKAFSIKPDYANAYNNMGIVLKDQGKRDEAIEAYSKALSIKPDYTEALDNMGNILKGVAFNRPDEAIQKIIIYLLKKKTFVRPKDISHAAISLLKFEPTLQKHLKSVDGRVIEDSLDVISDLSNLPLLLELMNVCPLPDLELEALLIKQRCAILSRVLKLEDASPELLAFQSSLALQCFTNEYIYNKSSEEEELLKILEKNVNNTFKKNKQPSSQVILTLASYKALNQYEWCNCWLRTSIFKKYLLVRLKNH